jgi:PAP2 superfamily
MEFLRRNCPAWMMDLALRMMRQSRLTSNCCSNLEVQQNFIRALLKLHCLDVAHRSKLRAITQIGRSVMKSKVLSVLAKIGLLALSMAPCATAQNAVTNWNNIAITAARASKAPGSASGSSAAIYVAYAEVAVYNAVNAIDGRFEPYKYSLTPAAGASADAAAIEAAYQTLIRLLPDQKPYLDTQYADPLVGIGSIPNGSAKTDGQSVGLLSAITLLTLRANDGRGANVPYSFPSTIAPGIWTPTPPAFLAPATPWVGQMQPFTFDDPTQFLPEPPPDLSSETWADDYNQVKALGAKDSTVRTPEQTEIALFWTEHTTAQYGRMLRAKVAESNLSLADSARLFAMVYAASADATIGCWNAKYHYSFWRPATAIPNGDIDGNPDTAADPAWTALAATPNHPEYPSAHGCTTGAVAETLKSYFGSPNLEISLFSPITNTTHNFTNIRDWQNEVGLARIYAGFHYQNSVDKGLMLGHKVAHHVLHHYFRPVRPQHDGDHDED